MPSRNAVPVLIVCVAILGFIASSCYFFYWAGIDDDFITLWSGETLGRDWWFINYNGERSEMTSSILAALVAKIAYWINPQAIFLINKTLLFFCAPVALWLLWHYRRMYLPESCADVAGAAAVATAASLPHLQCWSQSGMEAPLHTLLLTWYAFVLIRYVQTPGPAIARRLILLQLLLVLVRPEGFWVIGTTFAMLWLFHRRACWSHKMAPLYIVPLIGFLLLLGLRFAATGFLFPNPAYAKMAISQSAFMNALAQLSDFYTLNIAQMIMAGTLIIAAVMALSMILRKHGGQQAIVLTGLTMVILAHEAFFTLAGGGYGSPFHRMLVPTTLLKVCLIFYVLVSYGKPVIKNMSMLACLTAFLLSLDYIRPITHSIELTRNTFIYEDVLAARNFATHELVWPDSIAQLNWEVMQLHNIHGKDTRAVYDFIKNDLGKQIALLGQLRILTYQAGFFPYFIKKTFPDAPILFFDSRGLMDAKVGSSEAKKNIGGIINATEYALLLQGQYEASPLLKQFDPNMLYATHTSEKDRTSLAAMGWQMIYERPKALIWAKENH